MTEQKIPKPPTPPPGRVECGYCHRVMPKPEYDEHKCYSRYFFQPILISILFAITMLSAVALSIFGPLV